MDDSTMESNSTCDGLGQRWPVFVVSIVVIYIAGLSLCSFGYFIFWLLISKFKVHMINGDGEAKKSRIYMIGKACRDFVRQLKSGDTIAGKILISITLLCNLIYLALALNRSFPPHSVEECITIRNPDIAVEFAVACELLVFALVRFFACNNIIYYWFSPYTIVDVCTLPHVFISVILGVDWLGLRYLRFVWLTQITTVLQFTPLLRSQNYIDVSNLVIYFLILWLTSSGILDVIESQGDFWLNAEDLNAQNRTILSYVYLTMVTMSTVGYGDISPVTALGKAFMIVFIIGGLAFFAAILPKLVEVITYYYQKFQYAKFDQTRVPRHVIVCGHVTAVTAEEFLKDFLHPDRGDDDTHILFLHPERPDADLKNVLRSFYTRAQFLLGSVLNGKDLQKAHILSSTAIFILADKHADNPTEEDNANLLRVVSVKNTSGKVPVIVQVVNSFSKKQLADIEGWSNGRDIAVCLNELKLGLLAQSCLCPGFSTLIANLFYTADFPKFTSFDDAWKELYFQGASNEVYYSNFSGAFEGMLFHDAAKICYNNLNLVLLALEHVEPDLHHFYVNPSPKYHSRLKIKTKSMLGYFIAQDQCHVSKVSVYCECCPGGKHIGDNDELPMLRRQLSSMRRHVTLRRPPTERVSLMEDPRTKNGDIVIELSADQDVKASQLTEVLKTPAERDLTSPIDGVEKGDRKSSLQPGNWSGPAEGDLTSPTHEAEEGRRKFSLQPVDRRMALSGTRDLSMDSKASYEDGDNEYGHSKLRMYSSPSPARFEDAILNPEDDSFDSSYCRMPPKTDDMRDHIVLCLFADKNSPELGLHAFLKPLRSKLLPQDSIKPVVIICDKEFIKKEWSAICRIPKVYFVLGSPLHWSNLTAAKVTECSVCIVLTVLPTSSGHELAINDKEAILCSLSIQKKLKSLEKKILVITDLRQESNVQFLDFGDEDKPDERIYKAQPFACGEAFSGTMFDSVTSSVFHGPGTLYLVEDLIHSSGTKTRCQVIPVPIVDTPYSGRHFKEFYNAQLKKCTVCLGISRKLSGKQSYVITSPSPELELEDSDVAYILTE